MNILEINLNNLGFANFKKIIDLIIPKKERRQSNIIIGYIRIYTHLNNALNLMNQYNYKRTRKYTKIKIKKFCNFKIEKKKKKKKKIKKDVFSTPLIIMV